MAKTSVRVMTDASRRIMSAMDGGHGYFSVDGEQLWPTVYVMLFYDHQGKARDREKDNPAAIAVRLFGGTWKKQGKVYNAHLGNGLCVRARWENRKLPQVVVVVGSASGTAYGIRT